VNAISFCVSCMMMTTCWSGFAATSWALRCSAAAAGKAAQSARCMETRSWGTKKRLCGWVSPKGAQGAAAEVSAERRSSARRSWTRYERDRQARWRATARTFLS